tara:strand:- start:340 stop:546 length:207 start_codon:yes stop_codon:yes gene_type:complete
VEAVVGAVEERVGAASAITAKLAAEERAVVVATAAAVVVAEKEGLVAAGSATETVARVRVAASWLAAS